MKVLSPKEYKEQNQEAYLDEYIEYLERKQEEVEEVLENAKRFHLNNSVIEEIKNQSAEIVNILTMVERDLKEILFRSIDTFSGEDLLEYFNSISEERQEFIEQETHNISTLEGKIEEINQKIEKNLYDNGRDKTFYQAVDVEDFFKESISAEEYFEQLLLPKQTPIYVGFKETLKIEEKIQNIVIPNEEREEIFSEFGNLITKCRAILRYSTDAKEELIKMIYSENGIGKNLSLYFKENPYRNIVTNLINFQSRRTLVFYSQLPDDLRIKLILERFQGPVYQKLLETYQAYKSGESPINDDLNKEENEAKRQLELELESSKKNLEKLNREEQEEKEFLSDISAMKEALKKEISQIVGDKQTSTEDLEQVITDIKETKRQYQEELESQLNLLKEKQSKLEFAQSILMDPTYLSFFQAVNKKNAFLLYKALGEKVTEKVIEPYLEVERRRLKQIQIMCETEDKLEKLYFDIQDMIKHSNFFTRRRKSYREQLDSLNNEYKQITFKCLDDLLTHNLHHVYSPSDHPQEEDEKLDYTFSSLNTLNQTFWKMSHGISSETKSKFSHPLWELYRCELICQQENLICGLFMINKDSDNYYHFGITKDDRMKLIQVQTEIIHIIETEYNNRKSKREEIEKGKGPLDGEKVEVLESFLGKGSNLSQESVALFICKIQNEIQELKDILLSKLSEKAFYQTWEVDTPIEMIDSLPSKMQTDFDEKIKNLEIDGVTTMEEAIAYKSNLEEFNSYTFTKDKIKKMYLEKKI